MTWRKSLMILVGFVVAFGIVAAQEDPWWRPTSPQGNSAGVGYGTVTPTVANSGAPPSDGELFVQLTAQATANPQFMIYSDFLTAWLPITAIVGAGQMPSTLVTNAVDVANSVWGGTGELIFEGATANLFENEIRTADATVGVATFLLPDQAAAADIYPLMFSVLATNAFEAANSVWMDTNMIIWEGATADAFETLLIAEDADTGIHTYQLSDNNAAADTYVLMFSMLDTNALNIADSVWFDASSIVFEGATGADTFQMDIAAEDPVAADRTWTLPDMDADSAVFGSLLATNAPDTANSVWAINNGFTFEGATGGNAFEILLTAADSTVGVDTYQLLDRALAADTYEVLGVPDVVWTTGNLYYGEIITTVAAAGAADDVMHVKRVYIPHTVTVTLVDITSNPLANASAADNTIAVAIYYDADAGAQIVEVVGATDDTGGAATQLEPLDIADTTLNPGWYRVGFCAQDATDHDIEVHTVHADVLLIQGAGGAAGEINSTSTNPCVAGDPPATTGVLVQSAVSLAFGLRTQ